VFRPREFDAPDPVVRATHLPFLLGPTSAHEAFPPTLLSHGSARNEQLQQLTDGDEVLVVLPGPDAYVSAAWYRDEPDVPTWNYTAVHVSGRYRRLDGAATDRLLAETVAGLETDRGVPGWGLDRLDERLVRGLARGVIAFAVLVDEVRSAAKLSQDKLPGDVAHVRAGIAHRDGDHPVLLEMDRHGVVGREPSAAPSTGPTDGTAPGTRTA
jgi:transcriptional regulator